MLINQKERPRGAAIKAVQIHPRQLCRVDEKEQTQRYIPRRPAMQLRDSKRDRVRRENAPSNPIIPTSHPPEYEVPSMDTQREPELAEPRGD